MIIFNTVPFLSLSPGLSLLKISSEDRFISICKTISKFTPKNSKKRSVHFSKNAHFSGTTTRDNQGTDLEFTQIIYYTFILYNTYKG